MTYAHLMRTSVEKERVHALLVAYAREHSYGWQQKLAGETGVNQDVLSKLWRGERGPGVETLGKLTRGMRLPPAFFSDPNFGDPANYKQFIGKRARVSQLESRVEATPTDESALSQWDLFLLTNDARAASRAALAYAASRRNADGNVTTDALIEAVRGFDAASRGKAVHEPNVNKPMGANKMSLGPGKKGR